MFYDHISMSYLLNSYVVALLYMRLLRVKWMHFRMQKINIVMTNNAKLDINGCSFKRKNNKAIFFIFWFFGFLAYRKHVQLQGLHKYNVDQRPRTRVETHPM